MPKRGTILGFAFENVPVSISPFALFGQANASVCFVLFAGGVSVNMIYLLTLAMMLLLRKTVGAPFLVVS